MSFEVCHHPGCLGIMPIGTGREYCDTHQKLEILARIERTKKKEKPDYRATNKYFIKTRVARGIRFSAYHCTNCGMSFTLSFDILTPACPKCWTCMDVMPTDDLAQAIEHRPLTHGKYG